MNLIEQRQEGFVVCDQSKLVSMEVGVEFFYTKKHRL